MAAKRFKSKVDSWIIALLVIVIVGVVFAIANAAVRASDPLVATAMILLGIAIAALIVWLTLGTYYVVDRGKLIIAAGPIRWKVAIEQISSVEATRSPLSSPALSLDRLRIRYGKNRRIMISPADKAGFLKAIGHELGPL